MPPAPGLNAVHIPCPDCLRHVPSGRFRHAAGEHLSRHLHREGFATVVLRGSYEEAGDTGLHRVQPGDVVMHRPWERHLDRFGRSGAQVLVLPLPTDCAGTHGRVVDADALARLAERDLPAAVRALSTQWQSGDAPARDWPALLARDLLADPALSLSEWSHRHGLHPGSVSRGFAQVFEVSPRAYRLQARGHHALRALAGSSNLGALAQHCGFADQAHLNRTLRAMTGMTPRQLRVAAAVR